VADLTADADRDLILRVVYEEYYRIHPSVRQRSHWVMDAEMRRMFNDMRPPRDDSIVWSPNSPLTTVDVLLGLPVEIRDGAEGIRLVPDG
jgi:hypothetical protein